MSIPQVSSAYTDSANYPNTGQKMRMYVTGFDAGENVLRVVSGVRDSSDPSGFSTTSALLDQLEVIVTDSGGRTWTLVDRIGDTFILEATS